MEASLCDDSIYSHFHSLFNVSDAEIQRDHNFCLLVNSFIVIISHQFTENNVILLVKNYFWTTTN